MAQKIIYGNVNANGSIQGGTGFSITYDGTGLYDIIFTERFSSSPTVVVTQNFPGWSGFGNRKASTLDNAVIVGLNNVTCQIKTGDGHGDTSDRNFCFVAIGNV